MAFGRHIFSITIESENMNTKHTKGQWKAWQPGFSGGQWAFGPHGKCPIGKTLGDNAPIEKANAQLIATAPELLDFAIIVSRSACLQQVNGNECICFACLAKKLVDKATM